MSKEKKHITGFVMAGGKSSRMGQDKGLMLIDGKEMVLNVIEQVLPCVDELVIVSNNEAYKKFGFNVIEDLIQNAGPAAGIFTALTYSVTDLNFVVSCDMPFITTHTIEYLISQAADAEITIAEEQGKVHPLFGVYKKSCVDKLEKYIHQKELKLQHIIRQCKHKLIDMSSWSDKNNNVFKNINTRQEFIDSIKKAEA